MTTYYNNHKNDPTFISKRRENTKLYYQRLKNDPARREAFQAYVEKRKSISKKNNTNKAYYWANREEVLQKSEDWYRNSGKEKRRIAKKVAPWYYTFKNRKSEALRKGIEFTITVEYLESIWTDTCPILNVPLRIQSKNDPDYDRDFSPSLDRIDPSKGYVPGNVAIISYRANRIKNDGSLAELKAIVAFIESHSVQTYSSP